MSNYLNQSVHAVFVHVRDLKRSASWYSKLLNLPYYAENVQSPVYNMPLKEGVYMTLDDHTFDPAFEFSPSQHPAFNFFSSHLYATYKWVKQEGIQIVREVEAHGNFGWFYISDPDENVIMICGDIVKK
ncbi:Glyoxalase/Bleomycin resistance protein/Dioxygenase superfamily protein [Salinibacillus kushneri]|uniref:Glyoxalase/Bleomycin resistance protein/Dioxygenase superfamily protein n=1 Tax=Salinibacillus kushneri TaxID=237682 RepID=A0A1I0BHI8_9BACI|nr:VOC family protein [Salinibacillus kushneri]SET06009.1 Glyoxalase/Bleomycin resistance protein/Dioxygenase superfamily protein [Salinibacillus kushneri]